MTNGSGALSVVLPDVVVDCMLRTIPWTALTSSMWSCWERAWSSASVTVALSTIDRICEYKMEWITFYYIFYSPAYASICRAPMAQTVKRARNFMVNFCWGTVQISWNDWYTHFFIYSSPVLSQTSISKQVVNTDTTIKKGMVRLFGLWRLIYEQVCARLFTVHHVDYMWLNEVTLCYS